MRKSMDYYAGGVCGWYVGGLEGEVNLSLGAATEMRRVRGGDN